MKLNYNETERSVIEAKLSASGELRGFHGDPKKKRSSALKKMNQSARFVPLGKTPANGLIGNIFSDIRYAIRRVVIKSLKAFFIQQTEFNENTSVFASQANNEIDRLTERCRELEEKTETLERQLRDMESIVCSLSKDKNQEKKGN